MTHPTKFEREMKQDLIAVRNGALITPILHKILEKTRLAARREREKLREIVEELKLERHWAERADYFGYQQAIDDFKKMKEYLLTSLTQEEKENE